MEDLYEEYEIGCAVRNREPMPEDDWRKLCGLDLGLDDLDWI